MPLKIYKVIIFNMLLIIEMMSVWAGDIDSQEVVFENVQNLDQIYDSRSPSASCPIIRTQKMLVHYKVGQINHNLLSRIELWYSRSGRDPWLLYDYDTDKTSPITFVAPSEGLYRFLVVAVDQWGRRSVDGVNMQPPSVSPAIPQNTPAQMTAFVDYTTPRLYLLSPRGVVDNYLDHQLLIRWEGFDQNLDVSPVSLYYRYGDEPSWNTIAVGLAARGEYSWVLPQRLEGPVTVKAVLTDQAGNYEVQISDRIQIVRALKQWDISDTYSADPGSKTTEQILPESIPLAYTFQTDQAVKAFRMGNLHRERQDLKQASLAYEQALEHDSEFFAARISLANTLYEMGRYEEALRHFELCLQQKPNHPTVLFNLAKTQVALKQYDKAEQTLDRHLKMEPFDSWAWLMRGDAAQQLGKDDIAMNSWRQAMKGNLFVVQEQARRRLNDYQP